MFNRTCRLLLISLTVALTPGCASMLGLGESEFSCNGLPNATTCLSTKQIYKALEQNGGQPIADSEIIDKKQQGYRGADLNFPTPGGAVIPAMKQTVFMRVRISPWVDGNNNLHQPKDIITEIDEKLWSWGESVPDAREIIRPLRRKL